MVSANTDAVMFTIEEENKPMALDVLKQWENLTGLELEEDRIVKIIMRDVNNYCEIVETKDGYKVNYKGGEFKGKHKFKWDKEKQIFEYSFDDDIEANSLTIISEALLKNLLFNIPIDETINKCDDIFRFQMITHLGSTYEKCVQESPNGDIELQRNNRIYASNKKTGAIIKVKYNGRRDSLANCPPNPIVDNANQCSIDDVNKEWYIKLAYKKLNDFKGVKRLSEYKKVELVEKAKSMGIEFDPRIKKDELIKLIEERNNDNDVLNNIPPKTIDRSGQILGNVYFESYAYAKNKKTYWNCVCQCGNRFIQRYDVILKSRFKCCRECYNSIYKYKRTQTINSDGDTKTNSSYHRLYNIWVNMKRRCRSPLSDSYYRYGARGIDVCDEWYNSYLSFKEWSLSHGYRNDLTLDRINNDGNYEPSNCRWATDYEQSRNKRTNRILEYDGKKYCITDLAKYLEIPHSSFYAYLERANYNINDAVSLYRNNKDRKKD